MTCYKVTTVSGSVYYVKPYYNYCKVGYLPETLQSILVYDDVANADLPPRGSKDWEVVDKPVVGKRMYLAGKDYWNLTTAVASVEELNDDLPL